MKSLPSRWSISCWSATASRPSASISISFSSGVQALHQHARAAPHLGGVVDHAQAALLPRRSTLALGDHRIDQLEQMLPRVLRDRRRARSRARDTPTCGAARPTPGAAYIVSAMSSHERVDAAVDVLHGAGDALQPGVGIREDRPQSHAAMHRGRAVRGRTLRACCMRIDVDDAVRTSTIACGRRRSSCTRRGVARARAAPRRVRRAAGSASDGGRAGARAAPARGRARRSAPAARASRRAARRVARRALPVGRASAPSSRSEHEARERRIAELAARRQLCAREAAKSWRGGGAQAVVLRL